MRSIGMREAEYSKYRDGEFRNEKSRDGGGARKIGMGDGKYRDGKYRNEGSGV